MGCKYCNTDELIGLNYAKEIFIYSFANCTLLEELSIEVLLFNPHNSIQY